MAWLGNDWVRFGAMSRLLRHSAAKDTNVTFFDFAARIRAFFARRTAG